MKSRNASRVLLTLVLALVMAVPFLTSTRRVSANLTGAIYTTDRNGNPVNANIFNDCCDVCLNGGPTHCSSGSGLPPGDYYFQVTNPSGSVLLSSDGIDQRKFTVNADGFMSAYLGTPGAPGSCAHEIGIALCAAQGAICIQLMPFSQTPNPGNEYKVWVTPVGEYDPTTASVSPFGFTGSQKTDNFKCKMATTTPQSAIGGLKFTDKNANCLFDPGEEWTGPVVEIDVTLADGSVVTTQTDANGVWGLVFDQGTTFTACEVVPTGYKQQCPTEGQQAFDSAVDPVGGNLTATADANKCWVGTVTGADTASLNFANVLCKPSVVCPDNIPVCAPDGTCSAVVTYTTPTATDDCGGTPTVACVPASGTTFSKGTTTVTCTATDSNGQTSQCTFNVTVNDCQKPDITCPGNKEVCNTTGLCSAVVSFTASASDVCDGPLTPVCSPASGGIFPKGTTTVTCTATDAAQNSNSCSFTVTVDDCQKPDITCPGNKVACATGGGACSAAVSFAATANDNCDGPLTPTCVPASGSTFQLGITTVTCSVSDAAGNPNSCSFTVTVNDCSVGSISGKKFYDANADGLDNDGKVVSGWKVVLSGSASATAYTNPSGVYSFGSLGPGTYTVTEVAPNGSWVATKGTPCTFTISCANASNAFTCNFGNYCKAPSGGLTLGFWSNNNGKALITASDLCFLTSLHLRNANGSDFDPVSALNCPNLTSKQLSDGKTALGNWLLGANATNMANMLSAQFAAMTLNVRHSFVDGTAFDLCSGMTINNLLAAAEASLTANPNTTAAGATRTYQEKLKSCLDALNNNGLDVKSTPCSFTTPY